METNSIISNGIYKGSNKNCNCKELFRLKSKNKLQDSICLPTPIPGNRDDGIEPSPWNQGPSSAYKNMLPNHTYYGNYQQSLEIENTNRYMWLLQIDKDVGINVIKYVTYLF